MGLLDKIHQQFGSKVIKPVGPRSYNIQHIITKDKLNIPKLADKQNISNFKVPPRGIKPMSKEEQQRLIDSFKRMHNK